MAGGKLEIEVTNCNVKKLDLKVRLARLAWPRFALRTRRGQPRAPCWRLCASRCFRPGRQRRLRARQQ
jgi:hypothetical protein